jgi:hypothetical protein
LTETSEGLSRTPQRGGNNTSGFRYIAGCSSAAALALQLLFG